MQYYKGLAFAIEVNQCLRPRHQHNYSEEQCSCQCTCHKPTSHRTRRKLAHPHRDQRSLHLLSRSNTLFWCLTQIGRFYPHNSLLRSLRYLFWTESKQLAHLLRLKPIFDPHHNPRKVLSQELNPDTQDL